MRKFCFAEFNGDIAAVGDLLRIFYGFRCVREDRAHLILALHIELAAGIAHAVLVGELFAGLNTQEDIVGLRVPGIGIMAVVRRDQRDTEFLRHRKKRGIDLLLIRVTMILQLEEEVALPEAVIVFEGGLLRRADVAAHDVTRNLPGEAGGAGDDALVILTQKFHVDARAIVIALEEGVTHDLREILISLVVLREENEVIIAVVACGCLTVKTRSRRDVDLAAEHGLYPLGKAFLVEIDDAVHDAVIRDRGRRHSELFHPLYVFFYFIGAVEQGPLRVRMKVAK